MERRIFLRALGLGIVGAVAAPKVFDLFVPNPLTETTPIGEGAFFERWIASPQRGARLIRKNMRVTIYDALPQGGA